MNSSTISASLLLLWCFAIESIAMEQLNSFTLILLHINPNRILEAHNFATEPLSYSQDDAFRYINININIRVHTCRSTREQAQ